MEMGALGSEVVDVAVGTSGVAVRGCDVSIAPGTRGSGVAVGLSEALGEAMGVDVAVAVTVAVGTSGVALGNWGVAVESDPGVVVACTAAAPSAVGVGATEAAVAVDLGGIAVVVSVVAIAVGVTVGVVVVVAIDDSTRTVVVAAAVVSGVTVGAAATASLIGWPAPGVATTSADGALVAVAEEVAASAPVGVCVGVLPSAIGVIVPVWDSTAWSDHAAEGPGVVVCAAASCSTSAARNTATAVRQRLPLGCPMAASMLSSALRRGGPLRRLPAVPRRRPAPTYRWQADEAAGPGCEARQARVCTVEKRVSVQLIEAALVPACSRYTGGPQSPAQVKGSWTRSVSSPADDQPL